MTGGSWFGSPTNTNLSAEKRGPRQAVCRTCDASSTIHTSNWRRPNTGWVMPRQVVAMMGWNANFSTCKSLFFQRQNVTWFRQWATADWMLYTFLWKGCWFVLYCFHFLSISTKVEFFITISFKYALMNMSIAEDFPKKSNIRTLLV